MKLALLVILIAATILLVLKRYYNQDDDNDKNKDQNLLLYNFATFCLLAAWVYYIICYYFNSNVNANMPPALNYTWLDYHMARLANKIAETFGLNNIQVAQVIQDFVLELEHHQANIVAAIQNLDSTELALRLSEMNL